jgi:hypothetical protein
MEERLWRPRERSQPAAPLDSRRARPWLEAWARSAGPSWVRLPPWGRNPAPANHRCTPLGLFDGKPGTTASYDLACLSFGSAYLTPKQLGRHAAPIDAGTGHRRPSIDEDARRREDSAPAADRAILYGAARWGHVRQSGGAAIRPIARFAGGRLALFLPKPLSRKLMNPDLFRSFASSRRFPIRRRAGFCSANPEECVHEVSSRPDSCLACSWGRVRFGAPIAFWTGRKHGLDHTQQCWRSW